MYMGVDWVAAAGMRAVTWSLHARLSFETSHRQSQTQSRCMPDGSSILRHT
jgi:hypothetical protein